MSTKLPTIHKRADRELFFCYTIQDGKRIKKYLGKTKEEATTNLHNIFTDSSPIPTTSTPILTPSTITSAIIPINSTNKGGESCKMPHNAPNSPSNSDSEGNSIEVAYLLDVYKKAYKLTHVSPKADVNRIGLVRGIITELFPHITVNQMGVRQMVMVRDFLCSKRGVGFNGKSYSVEYVNKILNTIRKAFKWGVEYELVSYEELQRVKAAPNVKRGTTQLSDRGYENVIVSDEVFGKVLEYITIPIYRDILLLLRSTACRPSELLHIRGRAVNIMADENGKEIWCYYPESHKTKAKGKERLICLNEKEQEIIGKYKENDPDKYWFTPSKIRGKVDSPLESVLVSKHLRAAISRAIEEGAISQEDYFTVYSLRKTGITEMVKKFGIEVASKVAGHSNISTTDRFYNRSDVFVIQSVASRR